MLIEHPAKHKEKAVWHPHQNINQSLDKINTSGREKFPVLEDQSGFWKRKSFFLTKIHGLMRQSSLKSPPSP